MKSRAYREAVDQYGDMVYRIALNQTRSEADADDITQSVFVKLYVRGPSNASPEHLKRWLIRVTVNECKSLWRTFWHRNIKLSGVHGEDIAKSDVHESSCSEPDSLVDHDELYRALAQLPDKSRIVVHLFYFEGYSTSEIASILKIREATVRSRLSRARRQLKDLLKGIDSDEL